MADLKVALEDVRAEVPRSPTRRAFPWRRAVGASAIILLAVALIVWQPWRRPENPDVLRAVTLTTLPGVERYPSFSPDGNHLVFTWTGDKQDNQDLYVQMIGQRSTLRLTTDVRNDYNPVWSPDGRWIAFLRSEPRQRPVFAAVSCVSSRRSAVLNESSRTSSPRTSRLAFPLTRRISHGPLTAPR